jgi:hypothetical protein
MLQIKKIVWKESHNNKMGGDDQKDNFFPQARCTAILQILAKVKWVFSLLTPKQLGCVI